MEETSSYLEQATDIVMDYAPRVLLALLTLIIGFWIIGRVIRFVSQRFMKSGLEESLAKFLSSVISVALKVMLLFSVAASLGFETTSFIAIFSALMVGVGMALNGTLGHLASGVMLMLFRPFKVGDLVTIGGGKTGVVDAINAFNTTLSTLDNKRIIIANANVTGNNITNITGQGTVGVELTFGIGYGDDIDKARRIILEVGKACPHVLGDPPQGVVVSELGDSSVNLATRPFCKSENYWETLFFMQENVKKEFDKQGINIPFPQVDVHMIGNN